MSSGRAGRPVPRATGRADRRARTRCGLRCGRAAFEHSLDVVRLSQRSFDARASAAGESDDEIAWADVTQTLAVEDERHAGQEVRLADDELAALRNLDDDSLGR